MKAERIIEHRRLLLEIFAFLLIACIFIFFYKSRNPYSFPGIEHRTLFTLTMLGILVLLLYLPYGKIKGELEVITLKYNRFRGRELTLDISQFSRSLSSELKKVEENQAEYFSRAVGVVFHVLLMLFLLILLIQQIIPATPVNLDYLLLAVIIFGIIYVLLPHEEVVKREPASMRDYIFAVVMGIAGGIIVWYKTQNIGALSYIISVISSVLIILLSILLLEEE